MVQNLMVLYTLTCACIITFIDKKKRKPEFRPIVDISVICYGDLILILDIYKKHVEVTLVAYLDKYQR